MNSNIQKCKKCELSIISGEIHECIFEEAKYVGYIFINNNWYINCIAKGSGLDITWQTISPIPIPSYLKTPNSKHPNGTPEDSTEPKK